jgi:hypothetical protein
VQNQLHWQQTKGLCVRTRKVAGLSQKALSSGMASYDIVVLEGWDPRASTKAMTTRLERDRGSSYCGRANLKDVLRTCVRYETLNESHVRILGGHRRLATGENLTSVALPREGTHCLRFLR